MEGFDITALAGGKEMVAEVQFNDQVKVKVRYVPRETFAGLIAQATKISFDKSHRRQETFDNLAFGELLGVAAVAGWDGLVADGAPFPCTPENIRILMRRWAEFARFVSDTCVDLEQLVEAEREMERKNSGGSSGLTS